MDELTIQQLVIGRFSGELSQAGIYINVVIQTVAVLVGGIVVWRISNAMHRKKQNERQKNNYFETTYSKNWKKR